MRVLAAAVAVAVVGIAPAAAAPPAVRLVRVVGGLRQPVALAVAPGSPGRLYVAEQRGLVRVVARRRVLRKPFLDLRPLVRAGGLAGLLGLAFAPDYARSHTFVVDYVGRDWNVHVVRFVRGAATELMRVGERAGDADNHFGGALAFGRDGLLYVGVGDGGDPAAAQDPASALGKIVRLDAGSASPSPEVVASGLRNPWRFSFDRATGDLYVGDVGADEFEEVDVVPVGARTPVDFGWPLFEGRRRTSSDVVAPGAPLVPPLLVYRHPRKGCSAIVGGYVYRGRAIPRLRGRYVYGDFCSAEIRSVGIAGGRAGRPHVEATADGGLLSSFGEDARGELYALSYTYTVSRLERLAPRRAGPRRVR